MLTKVLIAAAFNILVSSSQVLGGDESCKSVYNAPCTAVGQCCSPMECYHGGDPYHCQVTCWSEDGCGQYRDYYGEMTCEGLTDHLSGFCK